MSQAEVKAELSGGAGRRKKKGLLPVVIMGAGRLGESLITLGSFGLSGFTIVGVFDKDPKRVGVKFVTATCGTHVVEPTVKLASRVHAHNVRRGIIAVPPSTAQEAADELICAGINVIVSYAPADVKVPSNVLYSRVDPAIQLSRMVPCSRFPWSITAGDFPVRTKAATSTLGVARLPGMWTAISGGSEPLVINPVLLTLVGSGSHDDEKDIEGDEDASTVTTSSGLEEEGTDNLGFFEFIQSNQHLFLTQQTKSSMPSKSSAVALEKEIAYMREGLVFRDDLVRARGTLVFGPSGCGKSALLKALAQVLPHVTFFFVGGEEDALVSAFRSAAKVAVGESVAAIVIENLDVTCRKRAFKSAFLSCTDSPAFNSVFILATTNAPWELETCLLRHFERRMYLPLPDAERRARVLENHFSGCSVGSRLTLSDFAFAATLLEGFSTSDVIALAKNAGLNALKSGDSLTRAELVRSAQTVRPTFCKEMVPLFASFSARFGTDCPSNSALVSRYGTSGEGAAYLSMYA
jgi:energy-coupling factor transporter ATP-binding protein EcfA2